MEKFTTLEGVAAPLKIINVDTDMIIPKQYLKTIKRTGLGKGLFAEQRYNDDGSENPDFVLNKPAYRKAKMLVAGDNFGCGSSREHAPWALLDFGIRCVISTSFGDIFYNNCFKNGILPIRVDAGRSRQAVRPRGRARTPTPCVASPISRPRRARCSRPSFVPWLRAVAVPAPSASVNVSQSRSPSSVARLPAVPTSTTASEPWPGASASPIASAQVVAPSAQTCPASVAATRSAIASTRAAG